MTNKSLDLDKVMQADRQLGTGHGTGALGPSDRSDTGSDMVGIENFDSDTDSVNTGERASVDPYEAGLAGEDIDADRIDDDFIAEEDVLDEADANAVSEDDDPMAPDVAEESLNRIDAASKNEQA